MNPMCTRLPRRSPYLRPRAATLDTMGETTPMSEPVDGGER